MRTSLLVVIVFILGAAGATVGFSDLGTSKTPSDSQQMSVTIASTTISVDVFDSAAERRQGLSGRRELAQTRGAFFVFPESSRHGFWMREMNFALDIIWLDQDARVVHIAERVSPESFPKTFRPDEPARYVLEVNAGLASELELEEGESIKLQ